MREWLENLLKNAQKKVEDAAYETSRNAMYLAWSGQEAPVSGPKLKIAKLGEEYTPQPREDEPRESTAQATYLLPRSLQRKKFLEHGYLEGTPGDYGLVRAAVGDNNFPVFQTAPDVISRDKLVVIGNPHISLLSNPNSDYPIPIERELLHAGYYPSALYIDNNYNVYRKSWDLNDYGNSSGRAGAQYDSSRQWQANLLDIIGSPTVVTTGFQPVIRDPQMNDQITLFDLYNRNDTIAKNFIRDKGLVPYYEEIPIDLGEELNAMWEGERPTIRTLTMFTLPEVTVTAKRKFKKNK